MSSGRRGGANEYVVLSGGSGDPKMIAGTADPSAGLGIAAPEGSIYLRYQVGAGEIWHKGGYLDTDWIRGTALAIEDEGIFVDFASRLNFVGDGVGAAAVGPGIVDVTIPGPNLGDGGAVVKRSVFVGTTVATSSLSYIDGMSGNFVTVPVDGDYWVLFESEADNQATSTIIEIAISVNSLIATVPNSERESQGPAANVRPIITTVQIPGLTAGDLIRCLFRKKSGPGDVTLRRKHLSIFKVQ